MSNQIFGNGLPGTVNSLTISNTGLVGNNTVTPVGNTLIATDLSVISGILDLGTFTVNRASAGGTFSMGANAGMLVGGEDGTNFPTNYSLTTLNCTSTVNYNFSGNQTVRAFNYGNLILSGSGIKTLQTSTTAICSNFTLSGTAITTAVVGLTIGGNLTIGTGTSFSAGAFSHQVGGNWTNQGTFNAGTSTFNFAGPSPGTITNSGTGDFFTISFGGLGTKTIASNLSPTGNIQQVATALVFSGSSTLTLSTGRSMEVNASGSVSTGSGRIILQPGSLYINRSSSNPTLEVRQNLTGNRGWRMIGSPVSSTYSAFTSGFETQGFPGSTNPTLQPNLLWWDETDKGTSLQSWRQPTNLSNTVPAGRGHYFYVFNGDTKPGGGNYSDALPKNISVTGTEVNLASSFFDFGVTYTPKDSNLVAQADTLIEVNQANEGFNLIANPTASVIDFYASSGWNKTNIDQTIYVWDPSVGEFLTWNGSTGTLGHGRIQPFQAFWVKANAPSPILRLTGNGAKSFISAGFYGRKMEDSNPVLELNVAGEGLRAQSLISFGQDGKEGADPKDAYQLESLAENWLLLYSFGSTKTKSPLVINHQPQLAEGQSRIIPLHLAASKKGEPFKGTYLMDWKLPLDWNPETEIVLMDHINQKAIDMRKENLYSFNFEAPKLPLFNSRKNSNGMSIPQAVVFQTPYEIGQEEEVSPNLIHSRSTSSTKPRRPFSIYIGSFPNGQVEYLPELPKLFAPSPNPFSKETKIRFYLPSPEMAELVIYNLMGQEVAKFPAQVYEAGIQELVWTPSAIDLQTGMYIIRLTTSSGQFTQKLIKN
ncbi:T9SS type A sorting domain-containing protein [Algoriphagus sp. AK58]|uniref:T9SS type A sorting domain-containing protein n=1 Tax=Algoriphagus sp. AK58 TaxID=1406877 RepID=UPI00164FB6EB